MDGASEFGPRALGHRSILAAPHSVEMRDRLNRDIKYREEFRPFAPVVPVEAAESVLRSAARRRAAGALHVGRVSGPAGVAIQACRDHARRRLGPAADARARHGAAAARAARGVRAPQRHSGAAQHLVQRRRRTDRQPRARGLLDVPALRDRRARRRVDAGDEAGTSGRRRREAVA